MPVAGRSKFKHEENFMRFEQAGMERVWFAGYITLEQDLSAAG